MASATMLRTAGIAIGRLLKETTIHLAVGSGLSAWDGTAFPQPAITQTTLTNELARLVASVQYLDSLGVPTETPTNYIQCTGAFGVGIANGTIREVGIFAFGTGSLNTGLLIAAVNIAAISKPAGVSDYVLTRVMRARLLE